MQACAAEGISLPKHDALRICGGCGSVLPAAADAGYVTLHSLDPKPSAIRMLASQAETQLQFASIMAAPVKVKPSLCYGLYSSQPFFLLQSRCGAHFAQHAATQGAEAGRSGRDAL